jgi:hypothetical protein
MARLIATTFGGVLGEILMKDYYRNDFRADLLKFLGSSQVPYFGHAWTHNCREQLAGIPAERRAPFLICLYFTVLVDQAMHAHFRSTYARFEGLTRYPKFCHGLSQFQHNPRAILTTPVEQGVVPAREVLDLLPPGMALFVSEVIEFLRDHMPDISPAVFFDRLLNDPDVELPVSLLSLLNPDMEEDVGCVAYKELRAAVARAVPRHDSAQ